MPFTQTNILCPKPTLTFISFDRFMQKKISKYWNEFQACIVSPFKSNSLGVQQYHFPQPKTFSFLRLLWSPLVPCWALKMFSLPSPSPFQLRLVDNSKRLSLIPIGRISVPQVPVIWIWQKYSTTWVMNKITITDISKAVQTTFWFLLKYIFY